jgi:hypothetical protein
VLVPSGARRFHSTLPPARTRLKIAQAAQLVAAARFGPPEELAGRLREARPAHLFLASFVPAAAATVYLMLRPRAVYLVDYACFRTASNCRVPFSTFLEHASGMVSPGARESCESWSNCRVQ